MAGVAEKDSFLRQWEIRNGSGRVEREGRPFNFLRGPTFQGSSGPIKEVGSIFVAKTSKGVPSHFSSPLKGPRSRTSASGELTIQVFDGTVKAVDLGVVRPFDSERRIQGKILLDHLNLEALTRLFSFGKISGYVQGMIENLSLGPKVPERFYLALRTEEVAGVPKNINVQAIENVSLLGTGWGELGGVAQWDQSLVSGVQLPGNRIDLLPGRRPCHPAGDNF